MGIENLKWWHWIVIGVVVGSALAYVRTQLHPPQTYTIRHGMSVQSFVELAEGRTDERRSGGFLERLAELARPAQQHPGLLDLVIHPPIEGKNYVTGRYLQHVYSDGPRYEQFELSAPIPFIIPGEPPPQDPQFTVRDYLDAKAPQIGYRYLWWKHPSIAPAIWGVSAAVAIGGAWPILLNLLIGAGFGRKREPEPEYDLERFSHEPEPAAPAKPPVSEEELARLRAVEEELERNLAAGISAPTEIAADARPAAAVKQLSSAPLEVQSIEQPEEDKEYQGEYYPVAKPHKHPPQKH